MKKLVLVFVFGIAYGDVIKCGKPIHEDLLCKNGTQSIYRTVCIVDSIDIIVDRTLLLDNRLIAKMNKMTKEVVYFKYTNEYMTCECCGNTPLLEVTDVSLGA